MSDHVITHEHFYGAFLRTPDEDGDVYGRFDWTFPKYCPENFGVHYRQEIDTDADD